MNVIFTFYYHSQMFEVCDTFKEFISYDFVVHSGERDALKDHSSSLKQFYTPLLQ
jgi:hypothetical protein